MSRRDQPPFRCMAWFAFQWGGKFYKNNTETTASMATPIGPHTTTRESRPQQNARRKGHETGCSAARLASIVSFIASDAPRNAPTSAPEARRPAVAAGPERKPTPLALSVLTTRTINTIGIAIAPTITLIQTGFPPAKKSAKELR